MGLTGFKQFFERQLGNPASKGNPENHVDAMNRELGINPNDLEDRFLSGPVELEDEGLWINQALWEIIKPVEQNDPYVRLRFIQSKSPSLNQRVYRKREDGQMVPYEGDITGRVFMVTMQKFAKMIGRGWEPAVLGQQGGIGGLPGL